MTDTTAFYPPGPTNWRQSLIEIQRSPTQFLLDLQRTYGNFVHYRHGPAHCYLINEPELIRELLVDNHTALSRPPVMSSGIGRFLGHGLLTSSGAYHDAQRKAIQPIFTPAWIASYAQVVESCVDELTTWQCGQIYDLAQAMSTLTSRVIYHTLFGAEADHLTSISTAINTLQRYSGEMLRRTPKVSEADIELAIEQLDTAVVELINLHPQKGDATNLLSRLLAISPNGSQTMTVQQVRDEIVTLLVAGQETSANALTWLFYLLARNPDEEARVRADLDNIIPELSVYSPHASFTGWAILEALRLYPPAWLIGRTPNEPYEIQGYTIQPGDSLVISPYVLHRTPDVFPSPDQFLPQRFQSAPPKYGFLPFGAGAHVCIGQAFAMQEIAITLRTIMKRWHFELIDDAAVEVEPLVTLQPKSPIYMKLHKR